MTPGKVRLIMKRLALATLFTLMSAGATYASNIVYDTFGTVFLCSNGVNVLGCGGDSITLGNAIKLSYTAIGTTVDATPATFANFGYLQVSCLDGTTTCASQPIPAGLTLALHIDQTAPNLNSGVVPGGTIFGALSGSGSSSPIRWGADGLIVFRGATDVVTYSFQDAFFVVVPPASCSGGECGQTTIQGVITDVPVERSVSSPASVPEPALSLLLASGLLAASAYGRLRRK